MFDQIEKIKQEYTDKYVVVDGQRAELARFKDLVGQVKTVNMSGRALVEFMDYHLNIGWFDIDLDYLRVVDKPAPKAKEDKKPAAKKPASPASTGGATAKKQAPAGEKKLSPLEMARQADSGKKADTSGATKKPSTADVLAKLRGEKSGEPASAGGDSAKPAPEKTSANADPPVAASPKKVDRSKMSVAEMIAAAKGEATPAAKSEPEPVEEEPAAAPAPAEEAASPPAEADSPGAAGPADKSGMSIDDMIAYCREHDA